MTRPDSYNVPIPAKSCANCRFSRLVAYKLDLLCFHGDEIEVVGKCEYPVNADYVLLKDGKHAMAAVGLMDGDEYDKVWGGRIVDCDGVCSEWKSKAIAVKRDP